MDRLGPATEQSTSLAGFLAVLLGFDARLARSTDEDYRVVVDGRNFDVGVRHGQLIGARGEPAAELRGSARDLLEHRRALLAAAGGDRACRFQIQGSARAPGPFTASFRR